MKEGVEKSLILEVEFAVAEFDDDRTFVVHLAGDDLLAEFVEYEPLQSTLDRPCTE